MGSRVSSAEVEAMELVAEYAPGVPVPKVHDFVERKTVTGQADNVIVMDEVCKKKTKEKQRKRKRKRKKAITITLYASTDRRSVLT
jgi:hypothetical protein